MLVVKSTINAPIQTVWDCWTNPLHITHWNQASEDWHTPIAENDLRVGGQFKYRMAAKDNSVSFDFEGEYSVVEPQKTIKYSMPDGRKVEIYFCEISEGITITESFEPENQNPEEMQLQGWQSILDNFKKYVHTHQV